MLGVPDREKRGRRTVERSRRGPGYAYEDFVRTGRWGRNSDRLERTAEFGSDDSLMMRRHYTQPRLNDGQVKVLKRIRQISEAELFLHSPRLAHLIYHPDRTLEYTVSRTLLSSLNDGFGRQSTLV